jgi:hypothetical protein
MREPGASENRETMADPTLCHACQRQGNADPCGVTRQTLLADKDKRIAERNGVAHAAETNPYPEDTINGWIVHYAANKWVY